MKKSSILILLAIIVTMGIGAIAAHQTDFIDLSPAFAKIPFLEGLVKKPVETSEELLNSPIEEENKKLREEKNEIASKITVLEEEKTKLMEQVTELQTEITTLKADKGTQETVALNTQELANYYREMKPEAVVKIMDNLDDETILMILPLLDKKQSSKIIALMDPQRAALITQLLLAQKS
mgnify:CR=1 FL=1